MTREIDFEVARRLGYQAKHLDTHAYTDQQAWCLLGPDGEVCHETPPLAHSEEGAWEAFTPYFSGDISMALMLVPEWTPERSFVLRQMSDGWLACITDVALATEQGALEETGNTPAEAICKAWLVWQQARESAG